MSSYYGSGAGARELGPTDQWARALGLAPVPLFGAMDTSTGTHEILLDGGFGSFAVSVTSEEVWRDRRAAEWAWSSGVPHHVTVTPEKVAVTRWDASKPELFSRGSVQDRLEPFYRYLVADRVRDNARVVDVLVETFRRVRALVAQQGAEDSQSIDAFLGLLALGIERSGGKPPMIAPPAILKDLPEDGVERLVDDLVSGQGRHLLALHPTLAIRHAGSEIFQEAHFALGQSPTTDLLGWIGPASAHRETRGTAHFTPPALARTIVERTLSELGDISTRRELTIMDPACGSGSFLYEAVRAIRRTAFDGHLRIVGRDISDAAIAMARFVLSLARSDWEPTGGMDVDLAPADTLTTAIPACDVILMNPPFLSWNAMDSDQRELTRTLLGNLHQGRADLSMAFVLKAMSSLNPAGAMGALVPASLLTLLAAEKWRGWITERADVRMLAFLGDYGLFRHATVQVAGIVLKEGPSRQGSATTAMIAGDSAQSTGDAFRAIRRDSRQEDGEDASWHIYPVPSATLRDAATWRLIPPAAAEALGRLSKMGATKPIGEIFDVKQGIRTGGNKILVISGAKHANLPRSERPWFRPAMMGDNLVDGRMLTDQWLFYPYDADGARITDQSTLERLLPVVYARVLKPHEEKLRSRASIVRSNRSDWWGLSERRAWSTIPTPRIVSKYFGAPGSFAVDVEGRFAVVQGYAWFLKQNEAGEPDDQGGPDDGRGDDAAAAMRAASLDLLHAYAALFNTQPFHDILRLLSSYVGGGQYDLSPRFVNTIPVPDLAALARDERGGAQQARLAALGRNMAARDPEWQASADAAVRGLYGESLFEGL